MQFYYYQQGKSRNSIHAHKIVHGDNRETEGKREREEKSYDRAVEVAAAAAEKKERKEDNWDKYTCLYKREQGTL